MSDAFRLGVRPPSPLTPPDWASENVKIANSERSSKFDIAQTPWLRAPMECGGDLETRQIVFLAPTGCGKSTMAEGYIPWVVSENPGPFLYASQTDPDARFWVETRLTHALKSCKSLDKLWPADRHKTRASEIIFPHMPFVAGGANISNFQEKSMRYLYGDEVWKWKKGMLGYFLKRHHDRWNRKVFLVSQAGWLEDDLDIAWLETDQSEWSFLCECGKHTKYAREVLKYDLVKDKGNVDVQKTINTARIECPSCKKVYADTAKVRRDLTNSASYIPSNKNALDGHRGFRMHRLAIWWIPWSNYVAKLLSAKKTLDNGDVEAWKQMKQSDDCIPWQDDMAVMKRDMKLSKTRMKDRDPKKPIKGETARFFTLDRGGDHFWGAIRAWTKGERSELLWEGYIADSANDFRMVEIQEKFGVIDTCVFVDIGFEWGKNAQMCADHGWFGIRGNGQVSSYRHKLRKGGHVEKAYSPIKIAQGDGGSKCRYIEIATDPVKDILARLMNGSGLEWTVPKDVSKVYKAHMKSEVRKEGTKGKTKNIIGYWEQVKRANHLWDCETYNVAAALMVGIFD